jgi:hypothetical protein
MRQKNAKKRTSHRRQKMYNMKGCSSFFRSSKKRRRVKSMKGGCDGSCPTTHSMIGGYLRRRGVTRRNKQRNGKSSSHSSSHFSHRTPSSQQGGAGIIPQDITNFFRSVGHSAGSIYNISGGYPPPTNPSPSSDQFKSTFGRV